MRQTIHNQSNVSIYALIVLAAVCFAFLPSNAQTTDSAGQPSDKQTISGSAKSFSSDSLSFDYPAISGWTVKTEKGKSSDNVKVMREDGEAQIMLFSYRVSVTEAKYIEKRGEVLESDIEEIIKMWSEMGAAVKRTPSSTKIGGKTTEGVTMSLRFSNGELAHAEMYSVLLNDRPTHILFLTADRLKPEATRVWNGVRSSLRAGASDAAADSAEKTPAAPSKEAVKTAESGGSLRLVNTWAFQNIVFTDSSGQRQSVWEVKGFLQLRADGTFWYVFGSGRYTPNRYFGTYQVEGDRLILNFAHSDGKREVKRYKFSQPGVSLSLFSEEPNGNSYYLVLNGTCDEKGNCGRAHVDVP